MRSVIKYLKTWMIPDILLLLLCYAVFFNQLGTYPIRVWDEGVYATNALEMIQNGNFLVKYFDGEPELWGTEPPMAAWLQTLSIKIFGLNETAIRIPSALAGLLTVFFLLFFFIKEYNSRLLGYISALVLISSNGYISEHVVRTGDLDSLLVFFSTGCILFFYRYIHHEKPGYLYLSTFFLILAVYTKSIAGLLFLPALFAYTIYLKKIRFIFSRKEIYISILFFITVVLSFYILREMSAPGYLKAAWKNEIATRYFKVNEGHVGPFLYYFNHLRDGRFVPWLFFLPFSFALIFILKDELKKILIFSFFCTIGFWLVISFSETKIEWYDAPLFPVMSILTGSSIWFILESIRSKLTAYEKRLNIIFSALFILAVFYYPASLNVKKITVKEYHYTDAKFGKVVEKLKESYPDEKDLVFMIPGLINPSAVYYKLFYHSKYNYNIDIRNITNEILINEDETLVFFHPAVTSKLSGYNFEIILNYNNGEFLVVKVKSKK